MLSRAEMIKTIEGGGSVLIGKRLIKRIEDLPDEPITEENPPVVGETAFEKLQSEINAIKNNQSELETKSGNAMLRANAAMQKANSADSKADNAIAREVPAGKDGVDGTNGKDGHTPTEAELKALIQPLIPAPIPGQIGAKGDTGNTGATGPQGVAGTPADMSRVTALENKFASSGTAAVSLSLLGAGATQDVAITFLQPMPNANYSHTTPLIGNLIGLTIGNIVVTVKSKAGDKMILTVKNNTLISLSGSFVLSVNVQGTS